MTPEEIKNTAFYKSLSELSNSDRGNLFEKHDTEIEKSIECKTCKTFIY